MAISAIQTQAFRTASGDVESSLLYFICIELLLAFLFLWVAWDVVDVWTGCSGRSNNGRGGYAG